MFDQKVIQTTSSWPFAEVRKLLKDRKDIIKKKKCNYLPNWIWTKWPASHWNFWGGR